MHGRLSAVAHSGHALFAGIPSGATEVEKRLGEPKAATP